MIAVQCAESFRTLPSTSALRRYARAALNGTKNEITLRIVGETESRTLNRRYRGKNKSTNVLSFSYTPPASRLPPPVFGDLALCAPVINREARAYDIPPSAHWAHVVVHGILHLLGYDHVTARDARKMQSRERTVLARLSFPDPYNCRR
ncbi:MAG: rRNA maturation RNase YbeY [Nevskiales bacterium]|nr:rRNA maturation RNase YbeY [Nevskiales bacterium]